MNSFPAKFNGWCKICDDQISRHEPITRWDRGYAHWRCTRGTKKPRPVPRKQILSWRSDGLELAREQVARYTSH
jgi:hypothetical protein